MVIVMRKYCYEIIAHYDYGDSDFKIKYHFKIFVYYDHIIVILKFNIISKLLVNMIMVIMNNSNYLKS